MKITAEYLESQQLSGSFLRRFFRRVEITPECWFWKGGKRHGYGVIGKGGKYGGSIPAHRASWIIHFGPIPNGLHVCHDCPDGDRRDCVNPAHLWLGTNADNHFDMALKGIVYNRAFTDEEADKIRMEYKPQVVSYDTLAKRYKVTKQCIASIIKGKMYRATGATSLTSRYPRKLTEEQESEICRMYSTFKYTQQQLADRFGVGWHSILNALNRARQRGQNLPGNRCKLTKEQEQEALRLYAYGKMTQKQIGKMFGVTQAQISLLVHGKSRQQGREGENEDGE